MLLKNRFAMEAPESFLSSFWPTLAEKLDGAPPGEDKPSNGGGSAARGGELVFKTSPAMQMLSIPETRPAAAQATPVVQAAPTHPWRRESEGLFGVLKTAVSDPGKMKVRDPIGIPLGPA